MNTVTTEKDAKTRQKQESCLCGACANRTCENLGITRVRITHIKETTSDHDSRAVGALHMRARPLKEGLRALQVSPAVFSPRPA